MADENTEFSILQPDELRDTKVILPELNGLTVWRKFLRCDYCMLQVEIDTPVFLVQTINRSALHLMCGQCWSSTTNSSTSETTPE